MVNTVSYTLLYNLFKLKQNSYKYYLLGSINYTYKNKSNIQISNIIKFYYEWIFKICFLLYK